MRPLQAHCRLGLGAMYSRSGKVDVARRELSMAREAYQAMDMAFWRRQAESALSLLQRF
jgi:hypothetical protein